MEILKDRHSFLHFADRGNGEMKEVLKFRVLSYRVGGVAPCLPTVKPLSTRAWAIHLLASR
jgi:hypothetical protein